MTGQSGVRQRHGHWVVRVTYAQNTTLPRRVPSAHSTKKSSMLLPLSIGPSWGLPRRPSAPKNEGWSPNRLV